MMTTKVKEKLYAAYDDTHGARNPQVRLVGDELTCQDYARRHDLLVCRVTIRREGRYLHRVRGIEGDDMGTYMTQADRERTRHG